jgi:hypothetical protein
MKKTVPIFCLLVLTAINLFSQQNNIPKLASPYLGQKPPGDVPQVFAKGVISLEKGHEYCLTMTPDGREIYFNRAGSGIMVCSWTGSEWSIPEKAAFNEQYPGGEVHITHDGKRLLMNRYAQLDSGETGGIWALQRTDDGWEKARFLIPMGMRASSTHDGSIYTTDITGFRVEGQDDGIISRWIKTDKGYLRDVDPDGGVNTESVDAHPFIAPDESYLLFNSRRAGGIGEADLYVCYRSKEGLWSEAVNMAPLNSEGSEWCATVSPDFRFLFFTRNGPNGGDIYWVNAAIIEELRPKKLK